jgi:hypothetical protein
MNKEEVKNLIQRVRKFSNSFRSGRSELAYPKRSDAKLKEVAAA